MALPYRALLSDIDGTLVTTGVAGMPITDSYVIGDTPLDIDTAHAVGCTAVAVATGHDDSAPLRTAGADEVLDALEQELPR